MALQPGDLQIIQNFTILHNRSQYEDHEVGGLGGCSENGFYCKNSPVIVRARQNRHSNHASQG
jgi:hypothetical protein